MNKNRSNLSSFSSNSSNSSNSNSYYSYYLNGYHQSMSFSTNSLVTVCRTTASDVMCIVNTSKQIPSSFLDIPRHGTLKPIATLPYKINNKMKLPEGNTEYLALKTVEIKEKHNLELKKERDLFFYKLEKERTEKTLRERFYIIKIQAIVRGFLVRPRTKTKKKMLPIIPIRFISGFIPEELQKLQNELCSYSQLLGLKPIPGLSLEARSKHNKRREKIILAAGIRIASFFKLTLLALRAKKTAEIARQNIQNRAAVKIQRFFRYLLRKAIKRKKQNIKRERAVLKIQTRFRIFSDWRRYLSFFLLLLLLFFI